jgi:hypothetical protein
MLGGSPSDVAHPVDYTEVPLGWWDSFLGYQWYGDPGIDFPTLYPSPGWDPANVYAPAQTTGMARGGVLRNGVRHFYGGGLSQGQLQAGLDAGNQIVGEPYWYLEATPGIGFDCAGTWNWIESAVVHGAPQAGKRWSTYDAAAGSMGEGAWESGLTPGGLNVGVDMDYTGHGALSDDGTHMAGDVMGTSFESTVPSGVHNGYGADSFGTHWTMGGAPDMAGQISGNAGNYGYGLDPSGNMTQQVGSWWLCQAPPVPNIGSAPMFTGVEEWMSTLPGITEGFLQQAGQQTLGTAAGYPEWGSTNRDWIIKALQGLGMDTDEASIAMLESLMSKESSGDPNATGPNGEYGLMQLMPETWAQWNVGGDPYDPVANLMASINYQMGRYGMLVDHSPYAKGGFALGEHLATIGEAGREMVVPLEDQGMAKVAQKTLGIQDMQINLQNMTNSIVSEIRNQNKVIPDAIAGSMGRRLAHDPTMHGYVNTANEQIARRANLRGGW